MALQTGDVVHLLSGAVVVGVGRVVNTSPDAVCHFTKLGAKKILIEVSKAFSDIDLPYPFGDTETLKNAEGAITLWNRSDVVVGSSDTPDPSTQAKSPSASPSQYTSSPKQGAVTPDATAAGTPRRCSVGRDQPTDYRDRKVWYGKSAVLIHPQKPTVSLAEGIITLNMPTHCLENATLGEDRVGVLIMRMLCLNDRQTMQDFFSTYAEGIPHVVSWDLKDVLIPEKGLLLSEMYSHEPDDRAATLPGSSAKRPYTFHKRKQMSAEEKRKQQFAKKKQRLTEDNVVDNALSLSCCNDKCCGKAHPSSVKAERRVYWALSPGERATMMLEKFHSRDGEMIRRGKMIFASKKVARPHSINCMVSERLCSSIISASLRREQEVDTTGAQDK